MLKEKFKREVGTRLQGKTEKIDKPLKLTKPMRVQFLMDSIWRFRLAYKKNQLNSVGFRFGEMGWNLIKPTDNIYIKY